MLGTKLFVLLLLLFFVGLAGANLPGTIRIAAVFDEDQVGLTFTSYSVARQFSVKIVSAASESAEPSANSRAPLSSERIIFYTKN